MLNVYVNNAPIKDNPFRIEIKQNRNYSIAWYEIRI